MREPRKTSYRAFWLQDNPSPIKIILFFTWKNSIWCIHTTSFFFFIVYKRFLQPYIYVWNPILQLQESRRAYADSVASCQKLKGDLLTVFNVLPKDMQQLLLLNPQRASLLRASPELTKLPGRPLVQVGVVSSISPR